MSSGRTRSNTTRFRQSVDAFQESAQGALEYIRRNSNPNTAAQRQNTLALLHVCLRFYHEKWFGSSADSQVRVKCANRIQLLCEYFAESSTEDTVRKVSKEVLGTTSPIYSRAALRILPASAFAIQCWVASFDNAGAALERMQETPAGRLLKHGDFVSPLKRDVHKTRMYNALRALTDRYKDQQRARRNALQTREIVRAESMDVDSSGSGSGSGSGNGSISNASSGSTFITLGGDMSQQEDTDYSIELADEQPSIAAVVAAEQYTMTTGVAGVGDLPDLRTMMVRSWPFLREEQLLLFERQMHEAAKAFMLQAALSLTVHDASAREHTYQFHADVLSASLDDSVVRRAAYPLMEHVLRYNERLLLDVQSTAADDREGSMIMVTQSQMATPTMSRASTSSPSSFGSLCTLSSSSPASPIAELQTPPSEDAIASYRARLSSNFPEEVRRAQESLVRDCRTKVVYVREHLHAYELSQRCDTYAWFRWSTYGSVLCDMLNQSRTAGADAPIEMRESYERHVHAYATSRKYADALTSAYYYGLEAYAEMLDFIAGVAELRMSVRVELDVKNELLMALEALGRLLKVLSVFRRSVDQDLRIANTMDSYFGPELDAHTLHLPDVRVATTPAMGRYQRREPLGYDDRTPMRGRR